MKHPRFISALLTALLAIGLVGFWTFEPAQSVHAQDSAASSKKKSKKKSSKKSKKSSAKSGRKGGKRSHYKAHTPKDMKGMWLSQFDLNVVYCAGGNQRSQEDYTNRIKQVLQNVKSMGINTLFVQVRPNGDSMYPSEVYPMSYYVVGQYGRDAQYDPFAILLKEAKAMKFSVHAWFNPLRLMTPGQIGQVPDKYRIKQWFNDPDKRGKWVVQWDRFWYLNPAYEETRQLIYDGIAEILQKYDVDGVHMDDYFYPTTDGGFDAAAYEAYKAAGGNLNLGDFRREQLNKLVHGIYETTKKTNPTAMYGISPAGNLNNVRNSHFVDIDKWCREEGFMDYVCPQVYWGFTHRICPFEPTCHKWQDLIKTPKVKLYIGMTLGNCMGAGGEWASRDVIEKCLRCTQTLEKCHGIVFFCYQYCYDPGSGAEKGETAQERSKFVPYLKTMKWKPKK